MTDLFGDPAPRHDPGGKRAIRLPGGVQASAVFGGLGDCYRYRLIRVWGEPGPLPLLVMMNPSTADVLVDDPTVAKVSRMARAWGYGGLMVGNAFAYRATDQARLAEVADPVGPENDRHLVEMAREAALIVMAYGTPKIVALRARGPAVARMLVAETGRPLHVFGVSNAGAPLHPLYLPDARRPVPWTPPPA